MSSAGWLLVCGALYVAVVIGLGLAARRRSSASPEDYFLAGRTLGPIVLFMALFGTNATSFVLVGIPAMAYEHGIGVFGLNAPIVALGVPLTFWAVGAPARRMALRLGALTPAELYAKRLGSRGVGVLLFLAFTVYTVPYMVQAVKGAALVLQSASEGRVPLWAGAIGVVAVALVYTSLGGMLATAWTNVFQGGLFLLFSIAAIILIASALGGVGAATEAVVAQRPELLEVPRSGGWPLFATGRWASWGLVISLTVIGFPHMFARLLSATDERALRRVSCAYPPALVLLWVPAVCLGFWGAAAVPGLANPDEIFQRMTTAYLPEWLGALGFLAVLAAVMSTLDAQLLTLSSMLVRDVLGGRRAHGEVWLARLFTSLLAGLLVVLTLVWDDSIFAISRWAFEGYTTLFPVLLLGVRWRGLSAAGAVTSILAANVVLALGRSGGLSSGPFLPAFWALVSGFVVAFLVSRGTAGADGETLARAFGDDSRTGHGVN